VKEYSDAEIIDCLRQRKNYVVHYLSNRYMPMIRLMVMRMGGSSEDAKDVFQEGLMIILEKIDNNEFSLTCKFMTFFYCVCENLWKAIVARKHAASNYVKNMIYENNYPENDIVAEHIDNKVYVKIIRDVFNSLDPVSKKVLKMHWQEKSHKKIAEELGYSYGYIRKKKCEAQAEMAEKVKRSLKIIDDKLK